MLNLPDTFHQLLSPEECAQIDETLLPTRDRFSIRMTVYSWRYLQHISQGLGTTVADLKPQQIVDWLHQDATLQTPDLAEDGFQELLTRLLVASMNPLQTIAHQAGITIEQLTLPVIIQWFQDSFVQQS